MKSLLLTFGLFCAVCFASLAQAVPVSPSSKRAASPWRFEIFPLNGELRYERDASQQIVPRTLINFAVGVRNGPTTGIFEYSQFSENSGNATLSVDRHHEEYVFWVKQNIMNFELCDLFVSGGVGVYREKVTTRLSGGSSANDSGDLQMMGGGSAGIQSMLFNVALLSLEGRLMAGKNFDPNPQVGMLLRFGFEF